MNLSLPPASCYPPAPIDYKINDIILGTVVTVNEWIRNELYRLQNNIRPRHCECYDQLVSFIVEPKLLDSLKPTPPPLSNPPSFKYEREDEDDSDDEEDTDDSEHEQQQEEKDQEGRDVMMEDHNTVAENNIIHNQPETTAKKTLRLPTTLCRVFLEMMRYCGRVSATTNNAPRLLLSEFDKLRLDVKAKKAVHAIEFREKLLKILFGKIQMTEYLVKCWKFMCEWVTRPPLYNQVHAMKWIEMTLSAFIAAKRLFLGERMREQQMKYQ